MSDRCHVKGTRDSEGNPKNEMILNSEVLNDLQTHEGKQKPSLLEIFRKYMRNDLYTDFDKKILRIQPNDCSIVQKYGKIETFPIKGHHNFNQITVNTFYSSHPLREFHRRSMLRMANDTNTDPEGLRKAQSQLARIKKLPVVIFIHGLGGQMSQFEPIFQEFRNCADIFGLDLPGFGNSKPRQNNGPPFRRLSQYSEDELDLIDRSFASMDWEDFSTDSIVDIIYQIITQKFPHRTFIILSHSMGTHLSIKLINKLPANTVESLCLLSPPELSSVTGATVKIPAPAKAFLDICGYFPRAFDFYRMIDRFGGLYSHSVNAYIYPENGDLLKRLIQLRWNLDTDSRVFLRYVKSFTPVSASELLSAASKIHNADDLKNPRISILCGDKDKVTPIKYGRQMQDILEGNGFGCKVTTVKGANHSIFLDRPHLLSGMIYQFIVGLGLNIDCTWVLQVRAIIGGDKWSMKNIEKWSHTVTISKPLINYASPEKKKSPLLGMKTLRETDHVHNPKTFEETHPEIFAIVDIGSDTPSYDPTDFQRIKYLKFKTESKVTPDDVTIEKFLGIIDSLVADKKENQFIAVHCHYGQNRTGFLISCYLVERLGWSVKESLDAFKYSKSPGIKHQHFKNALYLRYGEE